MGQQRDNAALMVVGKNMCNRILSLCEHGYLCNIENGPGPVALCPATVMSDLMLYYAKLLQPHKIKED